MLILFPSPFSKFTFEGFLVLGTLMSIVICILRIFITLAVRAHKFTLDFIHEFCSKILPFDLDKERRWKERNENIEKSFLFFILFECREKE